MRIGVSVRVRFRATAHLLPTCVGVKVGVEAMVKVTVGLSVRVRFRGTVMIPSMDCTSAPDQRWG